MSKTDDRRIKVIIKFLFVGCFYYKIKPSDPYLLVLKTQL